MLILLLLVYLNDSLESKDEGLLFFTYDFFEALPLSDAEKNKLGEIVKDIELELDTNIDKHSNTLIVSMIELLLNYCNRYYDRQFITRSVSHKDVISDFEAMLASYFGSDNFSEKGIPSIKYFAERSYFSPNYFSDLI